MGKRKLLCALVFLPLFTQIGLAQTNQLRGKVRSADGLPVNNAIVELRVGGGGMIQQTVTRNDGDFAFTGLNPGEYEVAVTAAGFEPTVQRARFNAMDRMSFSEVLNIEVVVRSRADSAPLAAPGTNFAQDVPKDARGAFERGMAKLRDSKFDEGVALLREATNLFGDYFNAHYALGRELFREGKDNEALQELERARQINDRQDAVYYTFGLVMLKQKKYTVAEYAFGEAAHINPGNASAHFCRGFALIEVATGSAADRSAALNDAEKELNQAWELSNKKMNSVYLQRARVFEHRGDKARAARELESYLKAEPEAKNAQAIRDAIAKLRGEAK